MGIIGCRDWGQGFTSSCLRLEMGSRGSKDSG